MVSWRVSSSAAWRADRLGEMGDEHRLVVDDRVAERLGLGAAAVGDPDGGQAERRLGRRHAGQLAHRLAGVHRQLVAGHHRAARHLGAAHAHHVLVGVERDVVVDAHRRDDHAELVRDLAPDQPTRASSEPPRRLVDQRHEAEADRQLERIQRQRLQRGVARLRGSAGGSAARCGVGAGASLGARRRVAQRAADREERAADEQERDLRQARHERERADDGAGDDRRLALVEDLAARRPCRGRPRRRSA